VEMATLAPTQPVPMIPTLMRGFSRFRRQCCKGKPPRLPENGFPLDDVDSLALNLC
jgi:hypothetical protein